MEALRQAGIEFEVIPGVTAALGAAAAARISLNRQAARFPRRVRDGAPSGWNGAD